MLTIRFHFKNIDESIDFLENSKSMLEGFDHKINIEDNGKIVKVEILKLKDKVTWEVKGKCFYMN